MANKLPTAKVCVYKINTAGVDMSKLTPGKCAKFNSDEQDPSTFDRTNSKFLPPIGVNPNGSPYYGPSPNQVAGQPASDRANHNWGPYRQYADVKYAYYESTGPNSLPSWLWWTIGTAAAAIGMALAL